MASTAKVSISVTDRDLLAWAKQRSKRTGVSLSALFTEAVRFERQMEAREAFLAAEGPEGRATPEEMAEIRAEWGELDHPRDALKRKGRGESARASLARATSIRKSLTEVVSEDAVAANSGAGYSRPTLTRTTSKQRR